jgi:hypothetical protein
MASLQAAPGVEERRFKLSPDGNSVKVTVYNLEQDRVMRCTMTRASGGSSESSSAKNSAG